MVGVHARAQRLGGVVMRLNQIKDTFNGTTGHLRPPLDLDETSIAYVAVTELIDEAIDNGLDAMIILVLWRLSNYITIFVHFPSVGPGLAVYGGRYRPEFRQNPVARWIKNYFWGIGNRVRLQKGL